MWSKIYIAMLGLSIAVTGFFTYYSWSWLHSIGQPWAAWQGYLYNSGVGAMVLVFSTVLLSLLANAVLWSTVREWAMWVTFIYFSVFELLLFFWLQPASLDFCHEHQFCFSPSPKLWIVFSVVIIISAAAITFFNQLVVLRLRRKMYTPAAVSEPYAPEVLAEE